MLEHSDHVGLILSELLMEGVKLVVMGDKDGYKVGVEELTGLTFNIV